MRFIKNSILWSCLVVCLVVVANAQHFDFPHGDAGGGGGGPGSDTTAIHDDTAGEIAGIVEKVVPVSGDLIVIEDSADSNNKKRIQIGNLPAPGGMGDVVGPASATDEAVCRYDGTTGKLIANSLVTVNDSGAMTVGGTLTVNGASINVGNDTAVKLGPGADMTFIHSTAQTPDSGLFLVGSESNCATVAQFVDQGTDFACSETNPTIRWHAADATVGAKNGQWNHNGADFVGTSATGNVLLDPALKMPEQASVAAVTAGFGTLYVSNTSPSTLRFKNDIDAEITLGAGVKQLFDFNANLVAYPAGAPEALSRNGRPLASYDDSTDETIIWKGVMSADYAGGSFTLEVHWIAAAATSGTTSWDVSIERMDAGGLDLDSDSFAAALTSTDTTNATSGVITISSFTFSQAAADGITAGDGIRVKVTVDTSDGTIVGDAQLSLVTAFQ